ncbi:hypothetical protein Pfo_024460 [Paulownia fortunei]|nr:hypothetical protein Pfo_024460 [Paulownia fortunei]
MCCFFPKDRSRRFFQMENNNSREEQDSSNLSWDNHNRPPQSQWLHSTLAELDDKIKRMLDLIEDNGDTFAKRAEMYYQKRPELIKMVQDLHRSYRALADKYDQLKSESFNKASNNGSVSNSFRKVQPLQDCVKGKPQNYPSVEVPNFNSESIEVFSAAGYESGTSSFEFQSPKNIMSIDSSNKLMNKADSKYYNNRNDFTTREHGLTIREKVWNEHIKFSKLLEENFSKQAELIKRNDEKRGVIIELRNKNRILSQKLSNSSSHKGTMKGNQTQKGKLRGLFCFI